MEDIASLIDGSVAEAYDGGYRRWKKWDRLFSPSPLEQVYFDGEFAAFSLAGKRVLEIGFGAGSFIGWAKSKGAQMVGCELIQELCDEGRQMGYDTRHGTIDLFDPAVDQFDLIVAMDVLEHIPLDVLPAFLRNVEQLLRPGGHMLARTPNGASPWGLVYQQGDMSHVTKLSPGVYEQLVMQTGLVVADCRDAFRAPDPKHPGKDKLRFALRNLINRVVAFTYGFVDAPLDPNLVAVLKKPQAACPPVDPKAFN